MTWQNSQNGKKNQKIFGTSSSKLLFANTRQSLKVGAVSVYEKRPNKSHFLSSGKIQFQFLARSKATVFFATSRKVIFTKKSFGTAL
jgi:hypothetical protein